LPRPDASRKTSSAKDSLSFFSLTNVRNAR
jgi:hypothetical protein